MDKLPEVTWSLMHPTPLNVDYMKRVITEAANYKVDSFELCWAVWTAWFCMRIIRQSRLLSTGRESLRTAGG